MALQLRSLFSPSCVQRGLYTPYRLPPAMVQYSSARNSCFTSTLYTPLITSARWRKPLQNPIVHCCALPRADSGSNFRFPLQLKGWAHYSSHSGKSKELADKVSTDVYKRKSGLFALYNSLNGRASTASTSKPKKATTKTATEGKIASKEEKDASVSTKKVPQEKKKTSRSTTSQAKQNTEPEIANTTFSKAENSGKGKKKNMSASTASKAKKNASGTKTSQTKKSTTASTEKEVVSVPKNSKILSSEAKKSSSSSASPSSKPTVSKTDQKGNTAKSSISKKSSAVAESINGAVKRGRSHDFKPLYPPTGKSVVVVESVTKAKVIQNYLGSMYEVVPSYGHVRDLAGRSKSVRPDEDFSMVWEVPHAAWTHLKSIRDALNGADNLILASDPDREGEAIAWHVIEMLHQQDALTKDVAISRVVFHEITESSIKASLQSPREIDMDLIYAYLARRALDYLIGFNISPVLWRKLPGCQSAGRVQSAALALICDRENEIEQFKPEEYWNVNVKCIFLGKNILFDAHLTHFGKEKLNQLSVCSEEKATEIERQVLDSKFKVLSKKCSKLSKNPPMPFITSTLQQESGNKLQFSASHTMKLAQQLYEGVKLSNGETTGLITYMRTDGFYISEGAAKDIVSFVKERYGDEFASSGVRKYSKKVKNAQEAHEAIRPTDIRRLPSTLRGVLNEDALKLYTLIWARTMACQMDPSRNNIIQVDIGTANKDVIFHSGASKVDFLGYKAVYEDIEVGAIGTNSNEDETTRDEHYEVLEQLKVNELIKLGEVKLSQHFTKPPPRYSEGALVKKMEELGIGRPSTYAVTIRVLLDRNYATMKSRVLHPEFRGRMVSTFLDQHFSEVTDYSFTAHMETELDNVSAGASQWKALLRDYWSRFSECCEVAGNINPREVETLLESKFGHILFAQLPGGNRTCPSCGIGTLRLKVSRFGAGYFIGCDQHPKCKYIATSLFQEDDDASDTERKDNLTFPPKPLGLYPGTDQQVFIKCGPYGFYIQLGENNKGFTPKRTPLPNKNINSLTLEEAVELLKYPVVLGKHPDDGKPVVLTLSKPGFFIKHRSIISPVPKHYDPKEITLENGLKILQSKNAKHLGRPKNRTSIRPQLDKFLSDQLT